MSTITILINVFSILPSNVAFFWYNARVNSLNNEKLYIWSGSIIPVFFVLFANLGYVTDGVRVVVSTFFATLYILFFAPGKKKVWAVLFSLGNFACLGLSEGILTMLYYCLTGNHVTVTLNHIQSLVVIRVLFLGIYILMASGMCKIWHLVTKKGKMIPGNSIISICVFQIMLYAVVYIQFLEGVMNIWAGWVMFSLWGIFAVVDLLLFYFIWQMENKEDEEYRAYQLAFSLEHQKNRDLELNRDIKLADSMKAEILEKLAQASEFLEEEKGKEACSCLGNIVETLSVKYLYSTNKVVDALVSAKAKVCEEKKIRLSCELPIGDSIGIKNSELCILFSNLLENGIRGCESCKNPYIRLSAREKGGYLVVRQENNCEEGHKVRKKEGLLPEHGLGLEILERLAEQYEGRLTTECRDGEFITKVSLKI